jgi:hypothetical protein
MKKICEELEEIGKKMDKRLPPVLRQAIAQGAQYIEKNALDVYWIYRNNFSEKSAIYWEMGTAEWKLENRWITTNVKPIQTFLGKIEEQANGNG